MHLAAESPCDLLVRLGQRVILGRGDGTEEDLRLIRYRLDLAVGDDLDQRAEHPAQGGAGDDRFAGVGIEKEEVGRQALFFFFLCALASFRFRPSGTDVEGCIVGQFAIQPAAVEIGMIAIHLRRLFRKYNFLRQRNKIVGRFRSTLFSGWIGVFWRRHPRPPFSGSSFWTSSFSGRLSVTRSTPVSSASR